MRLKLPNPFRIRVAAALQALSCLAYGAAAGSGNLPHRPALAVLDPVDLNTQKSDPEWGEFLRLRFAANPSWKMIGLDSMRAREKEFGFSAYRNCHEFQCAFDAGNIFSAEYVLFSSISRIGGIYAYTLNLVHVPASGTVWSRAGEAGADGIGNPRLRMEDILTRRIARLSPGNLRAGKRGKLGQITVLDLSLGSWAPARVLAERVATHLHSIGTFDIMGGREQDELIKALGIDKAEFIPTDSAVIALGERLGVTHLISFRLAKNSRQEIGVDLGYYDIAAHAKVKGGRSGYSREYPDIFRYETGFFASLFPLEKDDVDDLRRPGGSRLRWAAGAAGIATGIAGGILAYRFDEASRKKYGRLEEARSRESALELQGEAAHLQRNSRIWGAVGLAGMLAGGVFLALSF
jgi:hypothetical protein